jgi:Uncharacterised nucleotidyltransferase
VNSAAGERERLVALLAALEDPARAAAFSPGDTRLVAVARHHRLTPLLSITCSATLPPTLAETFRRDRIVTGARNMILGGVAEECIRALAAAGIPTIVLKGLDYETRLYGSPAARPTADVDLLVPGEHRRRAFGVLDRLGFEPRPAAPGFDEADYHEVAWTRAGVEVDLHLALAPLARCRIDYVAVWNEAEPHRIGATETRVLARRHAAVFQSLHMAIDHFDVPAIYLLDLARLLPAPGDRVPTLALAQQWRCGKALETALTLLATFLPSSIAAADLGSSVARRVTKSYGGTAPLPRREQLLRKVLHFDVASDLLRYTAIQSRRKLREVVETRFRGRSPRDRLALPGG